MMACDVAGWPALMAARETQYLLPKGVGTSSREADGG